MQGITSSRSRRAFIATTVALAVAAIAALATADTPIWANARVVRAIHTDCGSVRYLILIGTNA